jgi:hypothetical protein
VDRCDGHSIAGGDRADHGGTQHPLTGPTDRSTAIGLKNLHNCLNASGCVYNTDPAVDPSTSFLLVADPMRPNGGILMRFKGVPTIPLLGITFWGAAPTNSAVLNDNGTPSDPSDDTFVHRQRVGRVLLPARQSH